MAAGSKSKCAGISADLRYDDIDHGEFFLAIMIILWIFETITSALMVLAPYFMASLPFNWPLFVRETNTGRRGGDANDAKEEEDDDYEAEDKKGFDKHEKA